MIAAARPQSISKLAEFEKRGLKIRPCDVDAATPEQLQTLLQDVDTVITCTIPFESDSQKRIVDACKAVGVKRFIPSNWGTACVKGVMDLHDTVRDFSLLSLNNLLTLPTETRSVGIREGV